MDSQEDKAAAKALKDAEAARLKQVEAQAEFDRTHNADGSEKTPEQLKLEKLKADADDKTAKATELNAGPEATAVTMAEAKVLAVPENDEVAADSGHWRAQKFGNDPSNPQPANGEHADPEMKTMRLTRKTPDLPEGTLQETWVHPEMAGDYERAGWNRA